MQLSRATVRICPSNLAAVPKLSPMIILLAVAKNKIKQSFEML